jgi:hypothetical protein
MGVAFYYRSQHPVAAELRRRILEAASRDADAFGSWWCEGFCLFEDEEFLWGATKVFLTGYSAHAGTYCEVDPADDALMAWRDIKRILELLRGYARDHAVHWEVSVEDTPFGLIDGSDADEISVAMTDQLLLLSGVDAHDPSLPHRIAEIERSHAGRF